ncbi:hypothetical protein QW71_25450 [Paenibacillus sp. IHB B 3415]|nr:hypothetical protein QW71_25450 [Paenibacillus sp. IHB B 3415]
MKANNQYAPKLLIGSALKRFPQGERFHTLTSLKSVTARPPQERSVWRNTAHGKALRTHLQGVRKGPVHRLTWLLSGAICTVSQASGCPEGRGPWGPPYREGLGGEEEFNVHDLMVIILWL